MNSDLQPPNNHLFAPRDLHRSRRLITTTRMEKIASRGATENCLRDLCMSRGVLPAVAASPLNSGGP